MPERFDLKYVGADNAEHRPVVIHRAIFGSLERFIAILIEHFAGAFPLWLAPVQVTVLPIADRHLDYARQVEQRAEGGRAEGRARRPAGKGQFKIREAQLQKIPYMLVVGDREAADRAVAVRSRAKGDLGARPFGTVCYGRACRSRRQNAKLVRRVSLFRCTVRGKAPGVVF